MENNYKVRLVPITSLVYNQSPSEVAKNTLSFEVSPILQVSRSVEYSPITPVHAPGGIQVYKHTNSRTFSISAKLISRNSADAFNNQRRLQQLSAWQLPFFGATSTLTSQNVDERQRRAQARADKATNQPTAPVPLSDEERVRMAQRRIANEGVELRGAPPEVLYLYAYSTSANETREITNTGGLTNLNKIPVVLTDFSYTWPDDVDYIPIIDPVFNEAGKFAEVFPIKMDVSITLVETHSPVELERFDLNEYKAGRLVSF